MEVNKMAFLTFKSYDNRLLRERGMASTPKMEYQLFIFQKNSAMANHRGLKLDGAMGQGKIFNSLKIEKFSKSFLSHIGKNKIKF